MAQTTINNGDTGLVARNAINDNFTEVYNSIIEVALAQLDTDIEVTTGVAKFPIPEDLTFVDAFIQVDTAPTGSSAIWDININGATALSTKITIEATEKSSLDAASQPVFSTTTASKDDAITIDCDQIGATIAGQNPVLVITYKKT